MSDVSDFTSREHVVQQAVQAFHRNHHLGLGPLSLHPSTAVDAAVGTALYLWIHPSTPADVVAAVYRAVEEEADLIRAERRVEHATARARRRFAELDRQDAAIPDARPVAGGRS